VEYYSHGTLEIKDNKANCIPLKGGMLEIFNLRFFLNPNTINLTPETIVESTHHQIMYDEFPFISMARNMQNHSNSKVIFLKAWEHSCPLVRCFRICFDSTYRSRWFKRIVKSGHYRGCALVDLLSKVKIIRWARHYSNPCYANGSSLLKFSFPVSQALKIDCFAVLSKLC